MKELIQEPLDEIVKEYNKAGSAGTFYGVPVEGFDRVELLSVIHHLGQEMKQAEERHRNNMRLMSKL